MLVYQRVVEGEIYKQHQTTINHAFPHQNFWAFHEQITLNKQCNEQPFRGLEIIEIYFPLWARKWNVGGLPGLRAWLRALWSSKHPWHSSSGPDPRGWSTNPSEWPASRNWAEPDVGHSYGKLPFENTWCSYWEWSLSIYSYVHLCSYVHLVDGKHISKILW